MKFQVILALCLVSMILSAPKTEKPKKEMSQLEKDKYLACNAIMVTKIEQDKAKIDDVFKGKDEFLVKGLKRVLNLEIVLKCVEHISETTTHELYENYFAKVEKVDLSKYENVFD